MKKPFNKYEFVKKISHFFTFPIRFYKRNEIFLLRKNVNKHFSKLGDVYLPKEDNYLLAEGMYDSPNHYLRLRIFLLALKLNKKLPKLLGVLLDKTTRALPILKSLGFKILNLFIKIMILKLINLRNLASVFLRKLS